MARDLGFASIDNDVNSLTFLFSKAVRYLKNMKEMADEVRDNRRGQRHNCLDG